MIKPFSGISDSAVYVMNHICEQTYGIDLPNGASVSFDPISSRPLIKYPQKNWRDLSADEILYVANFLRGSR